MGAYFPNSTPLMGTKLSTSFPKSCKLIASFWKRLAGFLTGNTAETDAAAGRFVTCTYDHARKRSHGYPEMVCSIEEILKVG